MQSCGFNRAIIAGLFLTFGSGIAYAQPFTINDAIRMAVQTNPTIGEAAANRRATEAELHQNQATLLPQVRLEASAGPNLTNQRDALFAPQGNDKWLPGSKGSVVVRQLLFDGFASIDEIWRQTARVDAAAARVEERSGLTALDAAQAYINLVRYMRLVALAKENLRAHRRIMANVQSRFAGGRAGEGDLEQTKERVDSAEATLTEFRQSLADARATFKKVIGVAPYNLRGPGRLLGLPRSRDRALAITISNNPTLKAAQSDSDAARYAFKATKGAFFPTVSLEGRATEGNNEDNFYGHYAQESLQVVATWDIFRGGQDSWKRKEAADRYTQATMAQAKLQRGTFESVDKAWNARTITTLRITQLRNQIVADHKVITAYSKEYDLGQRSLIDLLNAENQLFNAQVSLESARGVAVYADYQLLAMMGDLLNYVRAPHPVEAEPLVPQSFGLFPNKLPPIMTSLPNPGPEPLNALGRPSTPTYDKEPPSKPSRPPHDARSSSASQLNAVLGGEALAYSAPTIFSPKPFSALNIFSPKSLSHMPLWPATDAKAK